MSVEHRSEIRRANRTTPIWIALVFVAATVAFVSTRDGGGIDDAGLDGPTTVPAPPTSETLTTTSPRDLAPVYGLADTQRGTLPMSTAIAPMAEPPSADPVEVAGQPVVTGDLVVALDRSQVLRIGEPGGPLRSAGCCWDEIHPSNEPGHVWGRNLDQVELIDLDAPADRRVVLVVGDDQVLGPASFGVVTRDDRNVVRWHRPSFEPTVVRLPADRRAIDSGGERLLAVGPGPGDTSRLETWSITGNGLLQTYSLGDGTSAGGVLSPDGTVVAVTVPGGWEVRDATSGLVHGSLPKVDDPVWVGGARFAATVDDRLVVSDSGELPLRWPVLAVAEQSP